MYSEEENRSEAVERTESETAIPEKKEKLDAGAEFYDWVQSIIAAFVVGILLFTFVGRVVRVDGSSMFSTLHNNDMVVTSKLFYTPQSGDIIVFQTDSYGKEPLVKRIIATEGQRVNIDFEAGIVYVDDIPLEEPYTYTPTNITEDFDGEVTVPEGCLFVMGDNRNGSRDSRHRSIGMVDTRCIIGKVLLIVFPGQDSQTARDWSRIGSVY